MPRGPVGPTSALLLMLVGLCVGVLAGLILQSRWSMLWAPVAFSIAVELARIGIDTPSAGLPHFTTYGLIAFVTGRGFNGLLALAPMVFGAAVACGIARARDQQQETQGRAGLLLRRAGTAAAAVVLLLLAFAVTRPGATDPIVGDDGDPAPGSVAELTKLSVGGTRQGVMIRGRDKSLPVLLFLAGGPGGSELGAMRNHLAELEDHFVVATWDQRGAGRSYPAIDPTSELTVERSVSDTIEVSEQLRERFGQQKIVLMGQSWGTLLGVLAVQRRPDLYSVWVGTGQMASAKETDRIFYRDTLAWAESQGREDVVKKLKEIGPPPYENILNYEPALAYEHDVYPYDRSGNSEGLGGFSENVFAAEYSMVERIRNLGAFIDTFSVLYPRIQQLDLRRTAKQLDVPVVLIQGEHEAAGRADLAEQWFEQLKAPAKQLLTIDHSGHRPLFERPDEFVDQLLRAIKELDADQDDARSSAARS